MSGADPAESSASAQIPAPSNFPVAWDRPDDARRYWTLDRMHWPAPVTPLDFAAYHATTFAHGFDRAAESFALAARAHVRRINTYRYTALTQPAESPEATRDRGLRARARLTSAMGQLAETWQRAFLPEIRRHLGAWEDFDLRGTSLPILLAHLDDTLARSRRLIEIHFLVWFPVMAAISAFEDAYRAVFVGATALDAHRLLQGFDNKTLETDRALWRLSRRARGRVEVRRALEGHAASEVATALGGSADGRAFLAELRAYLGEYGQRGNGWDVGSPSWIEDPTPVIRNLQRYVLQPERPAAARLAALAAERERLVGESRDRLQGHPQSARDQFSFLLKAAQEATVLTEDHAFWIDFRGRYRVRLVLREFGRRFAEAGALGSAEDVFYLTLEELRETAERLPEVNRGRLVAGRRAEMAYFRTIAPPPSLGTPPPAPPPDDLLRQVRAKFWGAPPPRGPERDVLRGAAASPGVVRGPARIVRSPSEEVRLSRGDVLVAETTAPAWTPLFATVAALVTDTGGVLSHGAIVAREYRIPAVVGTGAATARIRDGQILEVDGSAGLVRIVESD
jgi:pyruvate,water dikinase